MEALSFEEAYAKLEESVTALELRVQQLSADEQGVLTIQPLELS